MSTSSSASSSPAKKKRSAADLLKMREQRLHVAKEMRDSEKGFVQKMDMLEDVYYNPLKKILPPAVHNAVFSNIMTLRDLNRSLWEDLAARVEDWDTITSHVGDLFIKFSPFMKMYTTYVNNHERIGPLLSQMKHHAKYKAFRQYENTARRRTEGSRLSSLLIIPVQRIPRYKMLLERLLKYTEEDNPDYKFIPKALADVDAVSNHINESVRASENRQVILDIQQKFDNAQFIAPHRLFVVSGILIKKGKLAEDDMPYKFFLFNDLLVWARPRSKQGKYRIADQLEIDARFRVERVDPVMSAHSLKIIFGQQSFLVKAADERDASAWYIALQKCLTQRMQTVPIQHAVRRRRSFVTAPVYQAKDAASFCVACKKRFSFFKRKFNCKVCGFVCCGDCSKQRLLVEDLRKKVRACAICVDKVQRELEEQATPKVTRKKPILDTPTPAVAAPAPVGKVDLASFSSDDEEEDDELQSAAEYPDEYDTEPDDSSLPEESFEDPEVWGDDIGETSLTRSDLTGGDDDAYYGEDLPAEIVDLLGEEPTFVFDEHDEKTTEELFASMVPEELYKK